MGAVTRLKNLQAAGDHDWESRLETRSEGVTWSMPSLALCSTYGTTTPAQLKSHYLRYDLHNTRQVKLALTHSSALLLIMSNWRSIKYVRNI